MISNYSEFWVILRGTAGIRDEIALENIGKLRIWDDCKVFLEFG